MVNLTAKFERDPLDRGLVLRVGWFSTLRRYVYVSETVRDRVLSFTRSSYGQGSQNDKHPEPGQAPFKVFCRPQASTSSTPLGPWYVDGVLLHPHTMDPCQ